MLPAELWLTGWPHARREREKERDKKRAQQDAGCTTLSTESAIFT